MEPPGGRDSRFNLSYSMNLMSGETAPEIYGNPNALGRPSTSLQQLSPRHTMVPSACGGGGRTIKSDVCYDDRGMTPQAMSLDACGVGDMNDDTYGALQVKKSPPSNGKKTKGRVKIKMEYIENKLRRYTTFSKRKTGIMKKAYELSTLTGTQVMLLVASETGHVYTFATRKLQPMITSEAGKQLIQTCLNSPDPPGGGAAGGDQRMSATGFEETELTYNISDEDSKDENMFTADSSGDSSDGECGEQEQEFRIPTTTSPIIASTSKTATASTSSRNTATSTSWTNKSTSPASPAPSLSISTSTTTSLSSTTTRSSGGASGSGTTAASGNSGNSSSSKSNGTTSNITSKVTTAPVISPLLYQTPQGVMYATPSNNGMIFSLANGRDPTLGQFITIPLSLMKAANGQGELDLSKRK